MSENKKLFNKIKKNLKKQDFTFVPDYTNSSTNITSRCGSYLYEFTVCYNKEVVSFTDATYLQPEESNITFEITGVENFFVYTLKNTDPCFTDKEMDELQEIVEEKMIGKTYKS